METTSFVPSYQIKVLILRQTNPVYTILSHLFKKIPNFYSEGAYENHNYERNKEIRQILILYNVMTRPIYR